MRFSCRERVASRPLFPLTPTDLALAECSSDAEWVLACAKDNAGRSGAASAGRLSALTQQMQMKNPVTVDGDGGGAAGGEDEAPQESDDYVWSQETGEVEVRVPVAGTARPKDVKVAFKRSHLVVQVPLREKADGDAAAAAGPVVDVALFADVDTDCCSWYLEGAGDARELIVSLEKADAKRWPTFSQQS